MFLRLKKSQTTSQLMEIPSGSAGTRATLQLMSALTNAGKKRLKIRRLAQILVSEKSQKDYAGEARELHRFVRDNIRYLRDIRGVETLQTPEKTLQFKSGDCDDKSVLLASLLESIGHKTRFVAVGFSPDTYAHVYVEVYINGGWEPLETTEPWKAGRGPGVTLTRMVQYN